MPELREILTQNNSQLNNRIAGLKARLQELQEETEATEAEIAELSGRRNQNRDILKFMEEQEKEEATAPVEVIDGYNPPTETDSEEQSN